MNILVYTIPSKLHYARIGRCGGSSKGGEVWPPIKLMYAAAIARKKNNLLFIDGDAENLSQKEFLGKIIDFKPDFMISELIPSLINEEIWLINEVKKSFPNIKSVFIGSFASPEGEKILKSYKEIDYVVSGEAEETIEELISGKSIKKIKGVYYRDKGIKFNGKREFIKDLNKLPFPAHDLIKLKRYDAPFIDKKPFTIIETSRGCTYPCIYCNSGFMNGKMVRYRNPEDVMKEIKFVESLGLKEVWFEDETITLNKKHITELCNLMIKDKTKIRWVCNSRVDVIDEEILKLMKKAGCHMIFFGVESGNQKVIDYYKRKLKLEQIEKAFRLAKKIGLKTMAHFIVGAPIDSIETIRDSVKLAIKLNPTLATFNILTPYPGTAVYDEIKKNNLMHFEDWNAIDQSGSSILKTRYLSAKELEKEMARAYHRFYYRPRYIAGRIIRIRGLGDIDKIYKGLKNLISLTK